MIKSCGYFTVIKPEEIGNVKEIKDFECSNRWKEEDYKNYLESVQQLITNYEKIEDVDTINDKKFYVDFFNFSNRITVTKTKYGKYEVTDNGHHRMFIAKKYGLKLIVYVEQEEPYDTEEQKNNLIPNNHQKTNSDQIACILLALFQSFCLTVLFTFSNGWTGYHTIVMFFLTFIIYKIIH